MMTGLSDLRARFSNHGKLSMKSSKIKESAEMAGVVINHRAHRRAVHGN